MGLSRTLRTASAAAVVACLVAAPAGADPLPAGSTWTQAYLRSSDGTRLHADVFRPAGLAAARRTPVMLVVSPYLGQPSPDTPGPPKVLDWYRRIYEGAIGRGYSIVQVSFRGTGQSGGCSDFGGRGEQGDVAAAVDWAAAQPWSNGAVGMIGLSYDGMAGVVAVSQRDPALRAAVLIAPSFDQYRGVFMNGVRYAQSRGATPYYQVFGLTSPLPGRDPACSARTVSESGNPDRTTPFWRERFFGDRIAGARVPVLWAHGFLDGRDDFSAVRPDNFLGAWDRLAGPRRAWFGQFPHLVPGEHNTWNEPEPVGRDGFHGEALDWLDAHVKGDEAARARSRRAPPVAVQEGARGEWRAEREWPPTGRQRHEMALLPGAYTDSAGNKAEHRDDETCGRPAPRAACNPLSRTGQGTWTFSAPLPRDRHLAGRPRLRATLDTGGAPAQVIAIVYQVSPDNRATLLTRGASVVGPGGRVDFDLYPQDWRLRRGDRVGVLLTGSDDFYWEPGTTGARVAVRGGALELPLMPADATGRALPGGASRAVTERTSFLVDPRTVASRTSPLGAPGKASARRRLVLRVRPRRVRAHRRVTLRVITLNRRRARVPGARVRIGRRLMRTGRRGTLRARVRFTRPGRRVVRASKRGHRRARAYVRVLR